MQFPTDYLSEIQARTSRSLRKFSNSLDFRHSDLEKLNKSISLQFYILYSSVLMLTIVISLQDPSWI